MTEVTCKKCGKDTHATADCLKKKAIRCFSCNASGHSSAQCPSVKSGHEKRGGAKGGRGSRSRTTSLSEADCIDTVMSYHFHDIGVPYMDAMADLPTLLNMLHKSGLLGEGVVSQWNSLMDRLTPSFGGCLSTFDSPDFVMSEEVNVDLVALMNTSRIWGAIGCSPRHAGLYTDTYEESIITRLQELPRAVAWGPIGLDYSIARSEQMMNTQKSVFEKQLRAAVTNRKHIIITACQGSLEATILAIENNVPYGHTVHWMNYIGPPSPILALREKYPNLYLGITSTVAFSKQDQLRELTFDWPLDRLLLESGSPGSIHPDVVATLSRVAMGLPSQVLLVADKVAAIKRKSPAQVLNASVANLTRVYGMIPIIKPEMVVLESLDDLTQIEIDLNTKVLLTETNILASSGRQNPSNNGGNIAEMDASKLNTSRMKKSSSDDKFTVHETKKKNNKKKGFSSSADNEGFDLSPSNQESGSNGSCTGSGEEKQEQGKKKSKKKVPKRFLNISWDDAGGQCTSRRKKVQCDPEPF